MLLIFHVLWDVHTERMLRILYHKCRYMQPHVTRQPVLPATRTLHMVRRRVSGPERHGDGILNHGHIFSMFRGLYHSIYVRSCPVCRSTQEQQELCNGVSGVWHYYTRPEYGRDAGIHLVCSWALYVCVDSYRNLRDIHRNTCDRIPDIRSDIRAGALAGRTKKSSFTRLLSRLTYSIQNEMANLSRKRLCNN